MIGYRTVHDAPSAATRSASNTSQAGSDIGEVEVFIKSVNPPRRTLDDVRAQVAQEVAVRAITKGETIDGVKVGVSLTFSKSDDERFLRKVAEIISFQLALHEHVFAIATSAESGRSASENCLLICGSSEEYVQRAVLLASSKFIGRVLSASSSSSKLWVASIRDVGTSSYDEEALWDVVRKSARGTLDPRIPPPGSKGIDEILSDCRAKLQRITPMEAYEELRESKVGAPTFLVDIRPAAQREAEGEIPGALIIERNVLEWRLDPRSDARIPIADRYDLRILVFCQESYTSSLAAYALHQIGMLNSTDIIGGYQAWKAAGLPTSYDKADSPRQITEHERHISRPELRSLVSLAGSVV